MLYNANLDRSEPNRKPLSALRQELKKWEEITTKRKKIVIDDPKEHAVSWLFSLTVCSSIDKNLMPTFQRQNKSEFDRLIALARPRKKDGASSSPVPQPATSDDALTGVDSSTKSRSTPGAPDDAIVIDDE